MRIEIALKTLLETDEALSELVGDRIYPQVLPQAAPLPAVTYQVATGMTGYTLRGPSGLNRPRFQITAWGEDPDSAFAVADAIEQRLSGFRGQIAGVHIPGIFKEDERDRYEPGFENIAPKYGKDLDFYVWNKK